jgi:hypothetical protein
MRILSTLAATTLFVAGIALGAQAQVTPGGITPATAPAELYVPLRDAFLATLRANATTDQKFAYASALQKAQTGDLLGAQREAARAMLSTPTLSPAVLQSLKTAVTLPPTSSTLQVPMSIPAGPGVPQSAPQDSPTSVLAFARSEIDLAEMRVGHPLEDARASYVEAAAAFARNDARATIAAAHKAADAALDAYLAPPGR